MAKSFVLFFWHLMPEGIYSGILCHQMNEIEHELIILPLSTIVKSVVIFCLDFLNLSST